MNTALRAVHEALASSGHVPEAWRQLVREFCRRADARGRVGPDQIAAALRSRGVSGSSGEWLTHLRLLAFLDATGYPDQERADAVGVALELVGDSFAPLGPIPSWAPVATLPSELRALLRPPPVRETAGVLLELIDGAATALKLATPFVDRGGISFLSGALLGAGRRGVATDIITSPGQAAMFSDLARQWSSEAIGRLRVTEVATQLSPLGSHAKIMVADAERAYVGSANLTGAGLGRHIEIGVEVKGPHVADLVRILSALERLGTVAVEMDGRPNRSTLSRAHDPGTGSEAIDRRRAPMRRAYVVIEQPDIAACDLKRRGTVAEDPLEGEDVAAVRQESPREAVPQDVGRASVRDPRGAGKPPD